MNIGKADNLARCDSPRHTRTRAEGQNTNGWQCRDPHIGKAIGRAVVRVGKAEIGGGKCINVIFQHRQRIIRTRRGIVDRRDVDGHDIRSLIGILTGIQCTAIIADLKCKCRIRGAIGIRRRGKAQ